MHLCRAQKTGKRHEPRFRTDAAPAPKPHRFRPELVTAFKRLNTFRFEDIELLSETLKVFSIIRTTPHAPAEVSNLANSLPRWQKEDWSEHFSRQIQVIPEEWIPAATIARNDFMWLGLTDAALTSSASEHVILTIDFPLSNALESRGLKVINFPHLRSLWLE